ncbi:hypothetical protein NOVOSPHI9U_80007 [Novosphingobium sp. 9U]|nr:hypothetical protein NOVOSPHI9U_80007 [Novosphingobium sp. 9U]
MRFSATGCEVELAPIPRPVAFLNVDPAKMAGAVAAIEALKTNAEGPPER